MSISERTKRIRYYSTRVYIYIRSRNENELISLGCLSRLAGDKLESRDRVVECKCWRVREEKSATNFFTRDKFTHIYIYICIARNDKTSRGHTPGRKFRRCYRTFLSHRCDFLSFPSSHHCITIFFCFGFLFTRNTSTWEVRKKRRKLRRHALALPVSGPSHKDRDGHTRFRVCRLRFRAPRILLTWQKWGKKESTEGEHTEPEACKTCR